MTDPPEPRGMRVAVIGAAGFLGANLVRTLLQTGAEVHATVRPDTEVWRLREVVDHIHVHNVDILDADTLEQTIGSIAPQAVVNLATYRRDGSPRDRSNALSTNLVGLSNLLEATHAIDYGRLIQLGSFLEYGRAQRPVDESSPVLPTTFYGFTKASATLLCRQFAHDHAKPVVVLRAYSVYGPWQPPSRLIPAAVVAARDAGALELADQPRRDWVYVGDVVEACLRTIAADGTAGEVIDIGSGELSTNADVVRAVEHATGCRVERRPGRQTRPWDGDDVIAPREKAKDILGWKPRHNLQDGVLATADWMADHMNLYR